MGKSAFANGLSTRFGEDREISYICIPVHGPHASINCVVKHLVEKSLIQSKSCIQILHFDIAQSVSLYNYIMYISVPNVTNSTPLFITGTTRN